MTAPFIRARVSLIGHTSLGVVRLRYTDGGAIELDDGRRYGPGAIFSIEPVKEVTGPTSDEINALECALGAAIHTSGDGLWCIQSDRAIEDRSIYAALAKTIDWALGRANEEAADLRERLAKAEAGDAARAQRLLDAMLKLEPSERSIGIRRSPTYSPTMPGEWSLSVHYQPDAVKGSLDEVITYILDKMGKPAPIETPTEAPPADPEVEPTIEDDGTQF